MNYGIILDVLKGEFKMYTIDDQKEESLYQDDAYEERSWSNRTGLIIKIIIIILCIIALIWLIKTLKNNKSSDNGQVHIANTEKIRLAAEDYFFLKNNKNNTSYVTLSGLKNAGLIGNVVDANDKVCSDSETNVKLDDEPDTYKMTINFSCSTNDKDEVFYYHKKNLACLNCNGNTHMDGRTVVINDDTNSDENKADQNDSKEEYDSGYSCVIWSDWSKDRVYDSTLVERTKTMVTGIKRGNVKTYGEWSEFTTTPVTDTQGLEVETKVVTEKVWSEERTATSIDTTNPNIKVISSKKRSSGGGCSGFVKNNVCYSNKTTVGNLTYSEYISGNYNIKKENCNGVKTLQNSEGKYVLTFLGCEYNKKISSSKKSGSSYTEYTYQELETKDVTYYRYRTVTETNEPDVYTNIKYEEKDLPYGYEPLVGSEETYYSYKAASCEK